MKLRHAFSIQRGDVVSFIGAGGKTSALVGLGYELLEQGWRVLATTTTTCSQEQLRFVPHAMRGDASRSDLSQALSEFGFVFLYDFIRDERVYGLSLSTIHQLLDQVDSDVLLVEADRADGLPLKAPFADEPIIPLQTSLVIPVASLKALDQPLDDAHIYNAQAMIDKFGFYPGSCVRSPWIAQVLRDETLGLQGIPDKARVMPFINQTPPTGYLRGRARRIAALVLKTPRIEGVVLGSVRAANPVCEVQRPVGAIVLAGDAPPQIGQPTALLPWVQGKPIIVHLLELLVRARVESIVVVTGYEAKQVARSIKHLDVSVAHDGAYRANNPLSALQTGLSALPAQVAATLVVDGRQPHLQASTLFQLLMQYAEGAGDWLVPTHQGLSGYPMLLARSSWSAFLDAPHTTTVEHVVASYAHLQTLLHVQTDAVLKRVMTADDYHRERRLAGLRPFDLSPRQSDA